MSQQEPTNSPIKRALVAIDKLRAKLDAVERERREPIAIVGAGCRFPGGITDLDSFSERLQQGFDAITEVPSDRWDIDAYYSADPNAPGKMNTRFGGFLDRIDGFDAAFFGLSPREATSLDPQHRLLLEVAWEALEDSGHPPARLRGSATGVFVGMYAEDYAKLLTDSPTGGDAYEVTGGARSFAAGRLSYLLDLRGPTMVLDTVCSSSLVAIDVACQSLRNKHCDLALAGAVSLMIAPSISVLTSKLFALSPSGRCHTFDASADGYVRSEGCGAIVLKRLSDALANRDRILGVIRGSAVNHDGRSTSFTAPNVISQQEVITRALVDAGVAPAEVTYVEAHGTGTPLGDPIEIDALKAVFGKREGPSCAVGSVKTNLGHSESVAGMSGLLKVLTCFASESIPPHLHLEHLNPHINLEGTRLEIPRAGRPWPRGHQKRIAGVNSFGLSGTNAHILLEEPPEPPVREDRRERRVHVLPLSARSQEALSAHALRYAEAIRCDSSSDWLDDATYSVSVRREHHGQRLCVVGESRDEICRALRAYAAGESAPGIVSGSTDGPRRVAFVYSGQGSQWIGMGRRLLEEEPAFASRLSECDRALRAVVDFSVLEVLRADADDPRWMRVDIIQPLLFAMQVSLSALWSAWGVTPDAVIGHSLGEVAASVVAGTLSLEDGAKVIALRSRLVSRASGKGRMALVELSAADTARELSRWQGVSIASHHGPQTVLVSGDAVAVVEFVASLETRGVFGRLVDVDYASHSAHMDELLDEVVSSLASIRGRRAGRILQCSTVFADLIVGTELDAAYWAKNLREPVRFHEAIERLLSLGYDFFIEVSPHPVLVPALEQTMAGRGVVTGSLRREKDEVRELSEALARCYTAGAPVDWDRRYSGGARPVALPSYPWQRERYWFDPARVRSVSDSSHGWLRRGVVVGPDPDLTVHEGLLGTAETNWLFDHTVQGDVVVPAAVWLEGAAHAARETWGLGGHSISAVDLLEPLVLGGAGPRVQIAVMRDGADEARFEVLSASPGQSDWTRHARGRLRRAAGPPPTEALDGALERATPAVEKAVFYQGMRARGLVYGPTFQIVQAVRQEAGSALADLLLPSDLVRDAGRYVVHPALLDASLQVLAAAAGNEGGAAMPVAIESLRVYRAAPHRGRVLAVLTRVSAAEIAGNIMLFDDDGRLVLEVKGLRVRRLDRGALDDRLYVTQWEAQAVSGEPRSGRWLVFTEGSGESEKILEQMSAKGLSALRVSRGTTYVRQGEDAFEIDAARPADFQALLAGLAVPFDGILHLWSAETSNAADPLDAARESGCRSVLHLVKALLEAPALGAPRLWIATRATQSLGGQAVDVTHAPLWGLVRSLLHEHPELRPSAVDLGPESSALEIDAFVRELALDMPENQVVLRGGDRFVARVRSRTLDELAAPEQPCAGAPHRLEAPHPGLLDRLEFRAFSRCRPSAGEVEIEIAASGINFLDLLHAMGTYPGQAKGTVRLGYECAGRISALGRGVEGFAIGQEVVAIAIGSLATHATADARRVFPKPTRLSMEAAAAVPFAYLTAQYALVSVARLAAGERVLIHSASGGVGLAAIAVARRAGAEILATAGSETKRTYLRSLGIDVVMDSRTTAFAEQVMAATAGRGVDVVLNSLTGAAIAKGLSVLAPYGRFVEIGKKDIFDERRLGLSDFRRNLSYTAVDLAALVRDRPERLRPLMEQVLAAIQQGELPPLPIDVRPLSQVEEAFRFVAAAQHIGKLVAVPRDPGPPILPERGSTIRADASYLITGGLGGLGLAVARWLVDRGATRVVLVGRTVPSRSPAIEALARTGADIEAAACDVTNASEVARLVARLASDAERPLRGVIHAAAVLDDGLLVHQDWTRFEAVMAPKVRGAWNLHTATENIALDFFVMFSSAASLLGSPAQASYAAANAFLDAVAHHRRGRGLAGASIQWGPWTEIGLAAAKAERGERLAQLGMRGLHPHEALDALAALLDARVVEAGVLALDARAWRAAFSAAAHSPYFSKLNGDGVELPRAADASCENATAHLKAQIAKTFRVPVDRLSDDRSLQDLGCDSLTALELKNRLAMALGVTISAVTILRAPSVAELARVVEAAVAAKGEAVVNASGARIVPDPQRRHEPFPLTDIQQAYWIGRSASMALGSIGCHIYVQFEQSGLDPERLERAWQQVIARHDMLRAVVLADGRQRILPEVPAYRIVVEERPIDVVREEMAHQVFNPERWPLFDIRLTPVDADRIRIHFSLDLIAADPATLFQILGDWGAHYGNPALEPAIPALSFRDYILGALAFRETEQYRRAQAYWDARVDTLPGPPELPMVKDPASVVAPRFRSREGRLERALWRRFEERAAAHGVTSSAALLAAFAELLDAYSTSQHFVINLTLFSRLPCHPDVHEIAGDFTSTMLLEVKDHDGDFLTRAQRLHHQLLEDLDHAYVSGVEVLREIGRRHKRKTLMGVVFTSMVGHRDLSSSDWLGERVVKLTQTPQVYFDHQVLEHRGALVYDWDTLEELFPAGMLDEMFETYGALLTRLATEDAAWSEPSPTRIPDGQLARRRAAAQAITAPPESLLHEGFETQVAARPDALAVISSRRRITYADLDRDSNRIARWLRRHGVKRNTLVALVMEKGWEQVVGALGVLKAGAAYLPVDASLPSERVLHLLEHGEVKVALTQSFLRPEWTWPQGLIVRSVDEENAWADSDDAPLEPVCSPADLAYVLYTSGSTGSPKGVAMPHRGPVNTIADVNKRLGITSSDRVLALSSLSFDLSVFDVFGVLAAGGTIVLPDPESSRDPAAWLMWIEDEGVTVWNSVPALMQMLVEHANGRRTARSLRLVMLSGDWVPVDLPDRVRSVFDGAEVWSLGGPTEASIWQVSSPIGRVDPEWKSIPYGTPLSNHDVHVLDRRLRPRPDWAPGELYIGGRGLADGYWRDATRTAEAFIVHPETGERLYKSGDIGRWVPAGHIEFLGRNDHQVKIQGHRIELGEIEAALKSHPDVADAVVVARGEAGKSRSLVAYIVERDGADAAASDPRGAVLTDDIERVAFKLADHNVRRDGPDAARIALDGRRDPAAVRALYAERASRRHFVADPVPAAMLDELLGALAAIAMEGEPLGKFRYPSAGHLYPVQTYLHVAAGRVAGLDGGVYYHHPKEHALVLLSANARIDPAVHAPPNRRMAEEAAFSLFFIAQMHAIEPLYGALARDFCLIEAGAMAQLLMTAAHPVGLGLCEIGALDFDRIAPLFQLDEGHVFLHAMVGGVASRAAAAAKPEPRRDRAGELSRDLAQALPAYMVPSAFVRLERIPLTANGKIDRKALPDPVDMGSVASEPTPPASDLERRLVAMFAEEIQVERVGVRTHLFDLGFTSVQVVTLARRLRDELQLEVSPVDLFRLPTIEALAAFLNRGAAEPGTLDASGRADKRRVMMRDRRTRPGNEAPA